MTTRLVRSYSARFGEKLTKVCRNTARMELRNQVETWRMVLDVLFWRYVCRNIMRRVS